VGKSQIIRRIHSAAKNYKSYLIGNTYMFVYEDKFVEVLFKKSAFMHLTGVSSNLKSEDFYKHALARNGLRPAEIYFDINHPYDLADKKTSCLSDLYKITVEDVMIATDMTTATFTYSIGITNLKFVICLGNNTDNEGTIINSCMVPYSFRVEEIDNSRFNNLYEVTHILRKSTGQKKYSVLTFGNKDTLMNLPLEIQEKIEFE